MKRTWVGLMLLGALALLPMSAGAGTAFQQFQQDVSDAYGPYRTALFQTNQNDQGKSLDAMRQFQQRWNNILLRYADAPPGPYDGDPQWKSTLQTVARIATQSLQEIEAGQLAKSHATLEAIRDALGDLRQRNGVVVYSDHINAYHEEMEALVESPLSPQSLDAPALLTIRERLAVLEFLAGRLRSRAPKAYSGNEEFMKLVDGVFASLQALRQALDANAPDQIVKAVKAIKPAYARFFLRFG
jgi:hypothetical protein